MIQHPHYGNSKTDPSPQEVVIEENAKSVAGRPLPPVQNGSVSNSDDGSAPGLETTGSILLFYQYKEPEWTESEHKSMLKKVIHLANRHEIQGRGRIAPEGLNCTLSCKNSQRMRDFCQGLRELDPELFDQTDFKITDGVPVSKLFAQLSIRKTKELVAYGLAGTEKAPSIQKFGGDHLEALDYHRMMMDPDAVIIDVRNHYETRLGHFQPPTGGAELVDPHMRNSIEYPKWLAKPETQAKLHNKKVLMYCTGGIRCERATALLNQISATGKACQPKGVYHMRGGIERYVKTFPQGGFWKGKNYLFDKRAEQCPAQKTQEQVEQEVQSSCCYCQRKWTIYRGSFKCHNEYCGVPVIVCNSCRPMALQHPERLSCELCQRGDLKALEAPAPDLVGMKRKAESHLIQNEKGEELKKNREGGDADVLWSSHEQENAAEFVPDRLFLARLPLTVNKSKIEQALGAEAKIKVIHWLTDRHTGGFYGSCLVQLTDSQVVEKVVANTREQGTKISIDKKIIKIERARRRGMRSLDGADEDMWPPKNYMARDFPPVGHFQR